MKHRLQAAAVTIRGKIVFAFAALAAITALLGLYAVNSVDQSGRLVVATYDKPLMATSYARLALSNFMAMELALAPETAAWTDNRESLDQLASDIAEDLKVAEERASSQRAADIARRTAKAVAVWRMRVVDARNDGDDSELAARARDILADFDSLVEVTADDGFRDREQALAAIHSYRMINFGAALLVIAFGALIAILLSRQMIRPIAMASQAARRIADGDLEVEIEAAGGDELGQLLRSMTVMRDNIKAMVDREIAARRSAQAALAGAIAGCEEGVVLLDADGCVLMANSQFSRFFPGVADSGQGACLPATMREAIASSLGELQLANGRWVHLSCSVTTDSGLVVIVSDITAIKEREAALQHAKDEAEAASHAKSQFLATMSHELRTPLNAVIGFSEMISTEMMGPIGQPKYKEFANDIVSSGRHLLNLINDILDCAKLQSGRLSLHLEPLDAADVIEAALRIVRNQAETAGLRLVTNIDPALGSMLADDTRLQQVLLNLLSNAIKFTPAGGIVAISAHRTDTAIRIAVSDTGIGIAEEHIGRIVEPFSQVHNSLARKYGGTGLGLSISKMLIEGHGGTLTIESKPGVGTTVAVVLPAEIGLSAAAPLMAELALSGPAVSEPATSDDEPLALTG